MDENTVRPLPQAGQRISAEHTQDSSGQSPHVIVALEATATDLRERAKAAEAQANRAEAEAENYRLVADLRAETGRETGRQRSGGTPKLRKQDMVNSRRAGGGRQAG